ncbi:hypothetical protein [Streptomyces sp. NPDC002564]|uniref:hypothetical protein n=1 Tax=Streptomyces sp. NPDC002564 TaxID=3364649 RepID=UPI0036B30300
MSVAEMSVEERRARTTYALLLDHLDACPPCQAFADCPEGARFRRALRAARAAARTAGGPDE